ncbi:MAG: hypothetical protein FJ398_11995 [Verrucomicrobia bacterium]|nr:hypothetical protein [Verrucomicrobiota bacterium]
MNNPITSRRFPKPPALSLVLLLFFGGCAKQQERVEAPQQAPPPQSSPAPVSAEKNSFKEVTSRLDPGGDFYFYWSGERTLNALSTKVTDLRNLVAAIPEIPEDVRPNVDKAFEIGARLIKKSGLEEISGLGLSSIARETGRYHSKFLLHHYCGQNTGFIWSLFGQAPHALTGLDLLPGTTALAAFSDFDFTQLWSIVTNEIAQAGFAEAQAWVQNMPAQFLEATKIDFNQLLGSLGGEYGLVVTLDESRQIPIPMGPQPLQVPEPGLMLVVKVKNDTLFDRVEQLLAENPQVAGQLVKTDKDGLRMRTMPVPLPLPIALRPSIARVDDYLIVATTDALIEEAVAVKRGQKNGWKHSDEFKKFSEGLPAQGNLFVFLSPRFGQTVAQIQQQALRLNPKLGQAQAEGLQKLLGTGNAAYTFTVAANTDEGWLGVGNGNQTYSQVLIGPALAAPAGLLAAIAIPNFVKARQTAQRNAIMNNLRMIQGAKEQWALENKKTDGAPVTEADISPFLQGGKIRNIRGEKYDLNSVGRSPAATLPDGSSVALP